MPPVYFGIIVLGLVVAFVIWLWWYAMHDKSNSSDKSEKKPKKKLEIYPGHDDLM